MNLTNYWLAGSGVEDLKKKKYSVYFTPLLLSPVEQGVFPFI
jgi:hypothetical protein